jgi:hypothetical protein
MMFEKTCFQLHGMTMNFALRVEAFFQCDATDISVRDCSPSRYPARPKVIARLAVATRDRS